MALITIVNVGYKPIYKQVDYLPVDDGKILTGNHGFYHFLYGGFRLKFSSDLQCGTPVR